MTDFLEKKRHAASEDFGTNKGGYARCSYMLRGYRHRGVTAIYIGFSQRAFEEWRDSGKTALLLRPLHGLRFGLYKVAYFGLGLYKGTDIGPGLYKVAYKVTYFGRHSFKDWCTNCGKTAIINGLGYAVFCFYKVAVTQQC